MLLEKEILVKSDSKVADSGGEMRISGFQSDQLKKGGVGIFGCI